MSTCMSRTTSATHSTARPRPGGGIRLAEILQSGVLARRGNILDLLADHHSSLESRTLVEISKEDQDMLNYFNLDFVHASLFATILEDTLTELMILGECNNMLHIMRTEANSKQLRADKYGVVQVSIADELEGIDRNQLGKEEYKLEKLAADKQFFYYTVLMTYVDLSLNYSFESLAQQMAEFFDRDTHLAHLAKEEASNRIARRELARQLRVHRNHALSANYDMDAAIDHLRAQVEDSSINAETRLRYAANWQRARSEQHEALIEDAEAEPLHSIIEDKQRLDNEQRIHSELMLLIRITIDETIEKVEEAMAKYDSHMENMDLQIQIMKNNYQNQVDIRRELEEKYMKQEKDVLEWQAFKKAREDARLYREKITKAAIVAQAWWRGLLVRLQLGPYKPRARGLRKKK